MSDEVQKIKDRLSIVEVVGGYVQLKKAGRNWSGRCPFHKERTPSFMVSPERGTYMCFGCGEKGDIFSFVEKIEGIDFKTALQQLAEKAGVALPKYSNRTPEHKEKNERLREVCEEATKFFEAQLQKHPEAIKYISSRGIHDDTKKQWRIGYAKPSWEELSLYLLTKGFGKQDIVEAGLAVKSEKKPGEIFDRFRGRVIFPIFDMGGNPIAFSGRFFEKVLSSHEEGEPAKYVNSPETDLFKKSRILYGLNFAREYIRKADCILLVEGQFDVVLSHQSGLKFAVAVSGTALTQEHLSLMGRYSKRLVLALDADEAGIRAGLKSSAMALAAGFDVKIPKIIGGKDPADLAAKDPELLKSTVRGSVPAVEFFLEALRAGNRDERAYKKKIEAEVLPLVAAIPSQIDQAHFIALVSRVLRVPEGAVRAEVQKRPNATIYQDVPSDVPEIESHVQNNSLSTFEKTVLILLFHFGEKSDMAKRLQELIGETRLNELQVKGADYHERFLFEFEALMAANFENSDTDKEAKVAEGLLKAIEKGALEEEMNSVRENIMAAESNGEGGRALELMRRLGDLTRRREELRK